MKTKVEKDWIGLWYEVAKERGINDLFTFGIADTESNNITWHDYSHSKYDGIGALALIMKKRGITIENLPQIRKADKLSFWKKTKIIYNSISNHGSQKIKWKFFDETKPFKDIHDIGWFIFGEDETKAFQHYLKNNKLSENTFIMSIVSSIILTELAEEGSEGMWLFPVNMRGLVERSDPLSNHSSGVLIKVSSQSKPNDIRLQIKRELGKMVHLGNWWLLHIGKIIGLKGMKYLSEKSNNASFRIGSFSNLGNWDFSNYPQVPNTEAWLPLPPGTPNHPVGLGFMTWNNKFSMILKIHPSITINDKIQLELIKKIKDKILSLI